MQGVLKEQIEKVCGVPISIHGAGRTDAGVHAKGQMAHCDIPTSRAKIPWQRALNSLLPPDISILEATIVDDNFHARKDATAKIYSYTLWIEPSYILPQRRPFCWKVGRLDLDIMKKALSLFEGTHDFAAFQNTGTPLKNTTRTIFRAFMTPGSSPQEKIVYFCGDGFLKQMVRNLVGTLVWIGKGKLDIGEIEGLMKKRQRSLLPPTAPPQGLCLEDVLY